MTKVDHEEKKRFVAEKEGAAGATGATGEKERAIIKKGRNEGTREGPELPKIVVTRTE